MTTNIRNSLLSINFGLSCWEARRQDKTATQEVAANHGTASNVGRYHKDLLPGAVEHEAILKIRNAWRVWHAENTLPWNDNGTRVLRSAAFLDYTQGYRGWKDQFETALQEFYTAYPTLVAQAELRLNSLFNQQDYPDLAEVKRRFAVRLDVYPLPDAEDFRLLDGIPADEADHLCKNAVAGLEGQVGAAVKDLLQRMHGVVSSMAGRLDVPHGEKGGKFHDTLVGNISDMVARIPALNLTDDPEIKQLAQAMQELVCPPEVLRLDPDARADKAAKAKALAARMSQYVGD